MSFDTFADRHIGVSNPDELKAMLDTIGVGSVDELIAQVIPQSIRLKKPLDLPAGMSEYEFAAHIRALADRNHPLRSFIGMGYYPCAVPAAVARNVFENPAWYTSYTPYQAEISQGRLEALLNFQTAVLSLTGMEIASMDDLRAALVDRIAYFDAHGCRVSDHGLDTAICETATEAELNDILEKGKKGAPVSLTESEAFQTALLATCAREYRARGWVMQWHFGCIRNNSTRMFGRLGPDTGFDAMNDAGGSAVRLARMLDLLEQQNALPRTILYSLNPADNGIIGTVMGCFQTDSDVPGRIQLGSAWWFNDHKSGMEQQLRDLMNLGAVGSFVGMLTDSRSFLSYTRHEYFRRILCNVFGTLVENGEYPADLDALGQIVENISYNNTLHYFRFDEILK